MNRKYSNKVKKIEKFDAAKKREKSIQQLKKTDVKSDLGLVQVVFSVFGEYSIFGEFSVYGEFSVFGELTRTPYRKVV